MHIADFLDLTTENTEKEKKKNFSFETFAGFAPTISDHHPRERRQY